MHKHSCVKCTKLVAGLVATGFIVHWALHALAFAIHPALGAWLLLLF